MVVPNVFEFVKNGVGGSPDFSHGWNSTACMSLKTAEGGGRYMSRGQNGFHSSEYRPRGECQFLVNVWWIEMWLRETCASLVYSFHHPLCNISLKLHQVKVALPLRFQSHSDHEEHHL